MIWETFVDRPYLLPLQMVGFRKHLVLCFTANYCQNMALPYLGADQVGDAYYFSPVNVSAFGISDQTRGTNNDSLDAFVYMEHKGQKVLEDERVAQQG